MNSVEDYARKRTNRETEAVDTLSEWLKAMSAWLQIRISKLKRQHPSVFNDLDVTKHCPLFTTNMLLFLQISTSQSYLFWSYHIYVNDTRYDRSSLYWIPILHKCPYKERYNMETAKCSTNPISKLQLKFSPPFLYVVLRERPFNLKGGGLWFFF